MTGSSGHGSDWSSATHYGAGSVVIEPRMFTEADPMTGLLGFVDWESPDDAGTSWGTTTYVGRPRKAPPAGRHLAPDDDAVVGSGEGAPAAAQADSNAGVMAASRSMAVASLVSRITGFLRSTLLVAALGAADVGNAYSSANNFPNMLYELLLGGVLSSVLIPLLVRAQGEDDDHGVAYTQRLLSLAVVALGSLTAVAVLCSPLIAHVFAPPESRHLTAVFAYLLLPEIFFYGLGAMFMAVLNIRHSYVAGAWSPVLNNVIMIITLAVFWALPGPAVFSAATMTTAQVLVVGIGTTLGIAAQALVLIPSLRRSGFAWKWRFRSSPNEAGRLGEIGSLGTWVLAYVVVSQIGVSVIQYVGQQHGGLTVFTNADLLVQMPYGILVVSLLTAIMPRLSRAAARGDTAAVIGDLSLSARLSAVALLPVTAGLIGLGRPIGVTLFAHGKNPIALAELIGNALAASGFGLFPFALVMLQMRVFYAMRDGRSPTVINVAMVGTKVALVLISDSILHRSHPGWATEWLNISTSFSYIVGAVLGHVLLRRRLGSLGFGQVAQTCVRIGTAAALGGAAAFGVSYASHRSIGAGHLGSGVGLAGGAVAGILVLALVAWRMRISELKDVSAMLGRGGG